jgi:hypothetical protein
MMHNSLSRGNSISLGWQWAALTEIGVVALLISFQIHGICVLEIGDLSIAPWDWAIVALAALFVASIFLSKDKIRINRDFFAVSLLGSLPQSCLYTTIL